MLDWDVQNKMSEEIIHATSSLINIDASDVKHLINEAVSTDRKRFRYCAHHDTDEVVQEMFIVHPRDAYVRPHLHINKIESMLVLQGEVDFVTFSDDGSINTVTSMANLDSGSNFYHSTRVDTYHSLLIRSEWLVFLEITQGPFKKEDSIFAEWSPVEKDSTEVKKYIYNLEREIKNGIANGILYS
jgi:cupin fold WbuC family metalloprotein